MTKSRYHHLINRFAVATVWAVRAGFIFTALAVSAITILWRMLPFSDEFLNIRSPSKIILSDKGEPIRVYLGEDDSLCIPISLDSMSPWVIKATLAVEDRCFYSHHGVDCRALIRAIAQDVSSMRRMSGASTISMQLMRMSFGRDRTISSKLIESFYALQLESLYSKDRILEMYLNAAPYGGNVYGVEAASLTYFGKRSRDLTLGEATLLAGLPQSPASYHPDQHADKAYTRRDMVLKSMVETGAISIEQAQKAREQRYARFHYPMPIRSPHFCDLANMRFKEPCVESFINLSMQTISERTIRKKVKELANCDVTNGAVVIIDVKRAAVVAMVGSVDYMKPEEGQVNATLAQRSPGSALKPFLYALGYDNGILTPDTVVADVPKRFTEYAPLNFDKEYLGLLPAGEALAMSRNIPAVDLLRKIGVDNFSRGLVRFGFNSLKNNKRYHGLTLTLGGGEVSLFELADAYAALARLGTYQHSRIVQSQSEFPKELVLDKGAAWMVYDSLRRAAMPADPEIAWKTGTSWGFRDAWCIAYDADYVVAVWLGNFDGKPSNALSGADAAKPVVFEIFRQITAAKGGYAAISRPDDVSRRRVCVRTGLPSSSACPNTRFAYYLPSKTEQDFCTIHSRRMITDAAGISHFEVTEKWEPSIDAWLKSTRKISITQEMKSSKYLRIISPIPNDEYAINNDNSADTQRISLIASGSSDGAYFWYIDGKYIGESGNQRPFLWQLEKGNHTITVADRNGLTDSCRIKVSDLGRASP